MHTRARMLTYTHTHTHTLLWLLNQFICSEMLLTAKQNFACRNSCLFLITFFFFWGGGGDTSNILYFIAPVFFVVHGVNYLYACSVSKQSETESMDFSLNFCWEWNFASMLEPLWRNWKALKANFVLERRGMASGGAPGEGGVIKYVCSEYCSSKSAASRDYGLQRVA